MATNPFELQEEKKPYKQFVVSDGLLIDKGPEDGWKTFKELQPDKVYKIKTPVGDVTGKVLRNDPTSEYVTLTANGKITHIRKSIIGIVEEGNNAKG